MEDDEKWYRMAYMGYELEQEDWREESRSRVDDAIKKASRFHGTMQTRENMEALASVRVELQKQPHDSPKKDYNQP